MKLINKIIKKLNSKEKIAIPKYVDNTNLFYGKTALITGGTGDIGKEIANKMIKAGGRVIITGTNQTKLEQTCLKLDGEKCQGIVLDLSDPSSFKDCLELALKCFNGCEIQILINCAGYNPNKGFFNTTEKDFDRTLDINLKGTFFFTQILANYMIKNNVKGHILNISSSSALRPAWSSYEISKWAIKGFTLGLADLLAPHGIVVNSLAPGPTATKMQNASSDSDLDYNTPIHRMATSEEIASLAIILVSDFGNLVVGDTLYATGGSGIISLHR